MQNAYLVSLTGIEAIFTSSSGCEDNSCVEWQEETKFESFSIDSNWRGIAIPGKWGIAIECVSSSNDSVEGLAIGTDEYCI